MFHERAPCPRSQRSQGTRVRRQMRRRHTRVKINRETAGMSNHDFGDERRERKRTLLLGASFCSSLRDQNQTINGRSTIILHISNDSNEHLNLSSVPFVPTSNIQAPRDLKYVHIQLNSARCLAKAPLRIPSNFGRHLNLRHLNQGNSVHCYPHRGLNRC